MGDLLHTFSRREYRALSRTSHASAASSGTPRSRLLLSAVAAVMTVSGRASYVRQHECHTSTTPAESCAPADPGGGIGSGRPDYDGPVATP